MRKLVAPLGLLLLRLNCPAQPSNNVQVTLSLSHPKPAYKIGEPILLRLTLSATVETPLNTTTTDPASPVDQLIV